MEYGALSVSACKKELQTVKGKEGVREWSEDPWHCQGIWSTHRHPLTWQLPATHAQSHQQHGQERQQQGPQHVDSRADHLHLLGPGPAARCTPLHTEKQQGKGQAWKGTGGRLGAWWRRGFLWIPSPRWAEQASALVLEDPGPQGGQARAWAGVWGTSHPYTDPVPQPYLPLAPRPPLLSACLPVAGSCGERRVRAGNHRGSAGCTRPLPTPTQPVRRGRRPPQEPPWALQKGQLVSLARGNSYWGEEGKMFTGWPAAVASTAMAHRGSKERLQHREF